MTPSANHELPLIGKVAVVTGASSGIGQATAIALARAGADVIVHARRNRDGARQTADRIVELGREAHVLLADLYEEAEQERLVDEAFQWQGKVDVWVNNAGADVLTGEATAWSFERKFEVVWRVDVVATIRLSRLVGSRLVAQASGRPAEEIARQAGSLTHIPSIINMGWDQAGQGMAGDSGEMFAASKGAVMAFSRSLAQSLAPDVRVNCVAPGWIRTAWGEDAPEDWQRRATSESLLERWGMPEDVAAAIVFLASPAAAFINGQVLPINGGFRYGSE